MKETFEIGEIAICNPDNYTPEKWMKYKGEECTVIDIGEYEFKIEGDNGSFRVFGYRVQFADETILICEPHELKKRRPPETDIDQWAKNKITDLIKINPSILAPEVDQKLPAEVE